MATADSVKAKLLGLIAKANEATGNEDTDLTAAVDALIAGYGQGGGGIPAPIMEITAGIITPAANATELTIPHGLGVAPKIFTLYLANAHNADDNLGAIYMYAAPNGIFPADGSADIGKRSVYLYSHPTSGNRLSATNQRITMGVTNVKLLSNGSTAGNFVSTVIDKNGDTIPAVYNWVAMAF